jgi:hypothetical protein
MNKWKIVCSVALLFLLSVFFSEWSFSSTILVKFSVKMCRMSVLEGRGYLVKWGLSLLPNGGLTTKTEKLYAFLGDRGEGAPPSLKPQQCMALQARVIICLFVTTIYHMYRGTHCKISFLVQWT